jgi:hypothetical protein
MGAPALKSAVFLKNNGVRVTYSGVHVQRVRFERPNGTLTVGEAALALGTYPMLIHRLLTLGRAKARPVQGRRMIGVSECHRLRRLWRGKTPTVVIGGEK